MTGTNEEAIDICS